MKITFPFRLLAVLSLFWTALPAWQAMAEGTKPAHSEQADSVLVETISAGDVHACGLKSDGVVVCWGWDYSGQSTPPTMIFTQVSAAGALTCGLQIAGAPACWGDNRYGQTVTPAGTFTQISAGRSNACGIKSDRTLECWGRKLYGQSTPPTGAFFGRKEISAGDRAVAG